MSWTWSATTAGGPPRWPETRFCSSTSRAAGPPELVAAYGPRDGVAVPLRTADVVKAVLLVMDRTFEEETFGTEDLKVFEALAAHAAVALDKAKVVDRLRRLAKERAHEALHDPLTGLPNRRAFSDAVQAATYSGETGSVLLLDLDDFKDVNDTLGHSAGDSLLTVMGLRLTSSSTGTVARLGGDEFAVLLPGMDAEQAVTHARALHDGLVRPRTSSRRGAHDLGEHRCQRVLRDLPDQRRGPRPGRRRDVRRESRPHRCGGLPGRGRALDRQAARAGSGPQGGAASG